MNRENLERMGSEELERYANTMGFSVLSAKTDEQKRALIQSRRERTAEIDVMGLHLVIPMKRVADQRVVDAYEKHTDESVADALRLLLGEEQFAELVSACTEEDGLVDSTALAYATVEILNSDALKNF